MCHEERLSISIQSIKSFPTPRPPFIYFYSLDPAMTKIVSLSGLSFSCGNKQDQKLIRWKSVPPVSSGPQSQERSDRETTITRSTTKRPARQALLLIRGTCDRARLGRPFPSFPSLLQTILIRKSYSDQKYNETCSARFVSRHPSIARVQADGIPSHTYSLDPTTKLETGAISTQCEPLDQRFRAILWSRKDVL